MKDFFVQKLNGFRKRVKAGQFGIYYLRDRGFVIPRKLKINGRSREFQFADPDSDDLAYEFNEICLYDCYRLKLLKQRLGEIRTVVDIGANQGLFLIAARQVFPTATITGYEPNEALRSVLGHNAQALEATVNFEAVSAKTGRASLIFGNSDLHTRSIQSDTGNIPATSLAEVVQRAGGSIDILKLDCEGAEWELFQDRASWSRIRSVTMEYHLWAKPGSRFEDVKKALQTFNYEIVGHSALDNSFGLLTAIRKGY